MAPSKIIDPFKLGAKKPMYCKLLYPASVGTITAAALALSSTILEKQPTLLDDIKLPRAVEAIPKPVLLALLGFPVGYLATKLANWIRWKAIQRLLEYQGWIQGGKGFKTKAWAMLLTLLKGPGPDSTYDYQRYLPKQPLPNLDQTLDKWLQVASQIVTKEEFEQTKSAVEMFRNNEAPKLQEHLKKRYNSEVNWLSEYWSNAAYLSSRDSLVLNSNYFTMNRSPLEYITTNMRAAENTHKVLQFYELLVTEKLPPIVLQELVPLCMNGFRNIFSTVRIPGENVDRIHRYPGETHIVVVRNGHYYAMDVYTSAGSKTKKRLLYAQEIKMQLDRICKDAEGLTCELPVSSLTSQNRTIWAKQREKLAIKNQHTLKCVESSLIMLYLDTEPVKGKDEHIRLILTGRGGDRWYDKSISSVVFDGGVSGFNIEHSSCDGMLIATLTEFCLTFEKYQKYCQPDAASVENLPPAIHLSWDLDDMKDDIKTANDELRKKADSVETHLVNTVYGKGFMKKTRNSPDGYLQMAIQLAYYRLHNETPNTYEPSTCRLYALGRTENIHPMSVHSKAWVASMLDPSSTVQTRIGLLKKAVSSQTTARMYATIGQGCDRHLIGLYCASRELGMDVPALFLDKAWQLPYKLSTSQTPTGTVDMKTTLDLKWVIGGFAPGCLNGYGVAYMFMGDDYINIALSAWNACEETSAVTFGNAIHQSFEDMRQLFA